MRYHWSLLLGVYVCMCMHMCVLGNSSNSLILRQLLNDYQDCCGILLIAFFDSLLVVEKPLFVQTLRLTLQAFQPTCT